MSKDKKGVPLSQLGAPTAKEKAAAEFQHFTKMRDLAKQQKGAAEIRQAELVARGMTAEQTRGSFERLKDEAVRAFFGEDGIPPDLKEGWAVYEQRCKARAEVGAPLPPGGCLLLGREAALGGAMAEAHMKLAMGLRISTQAIKLRLKRDEVGRVNLVADIDSPDDWIVPVARGDLNQDPREAARIYIQSILRHVNDWFRAEVARRIETCEHIRPELQQNLTPWVDG